MAGVVAAHGIAAGMQANARQLASRKAARRDERRRDKFDTRWRNATTCVPSTTPLIPWPVMVMPKIVLSKLLNRIVASLRSRAAKKRNKPKMVKTYGVLPVYEADNPPKITYLAANLAAAS